MAMDVQTGGRGRRGVRPSMNVTPLVDVVLVLLIIFMVITPLLTKRMWTRVPEKDDKAETPPPSSGEVTPPLVVTVEADGVRVNVEIVPEAELATRFARVVAARSDRVVFFDAGDEVSYGRAVEVMDALRGAGALTIAVLPERPAR